MMTQIGWGKFMGRGRMSMWGIPVHHPNQRTDLTQPCCDYPSPPDGMFHNISQRSEGIPPPQYLKNPYITSYGCGGTNKGHVSGRI